MTLTDQPKAQATRNTARIHAESGSDTCVTIRGQRVDATLTLEDGRCVQVSILNSGHVVLRAWAAEPYATDNAEACSVSFRLPKLEDMVLDSAQVSDIYFRTPTLTERSLASPEEHNGTWYYATQAIQQRVEAIKMLLALRRGSDPDPALHSDSVPLLNRNPT